MKSYRISRGTVNKGASYDIREVEIKATECGYVTTSGKRIKSLDEPDVKITITVYSESRDTRRINRLCSRIRRAMEEYKSELKGGLNEQK